MNKRLHSSPLLVQELRVGDTLGFYDSGVFSAVYMIKKVKGFTDDWRMPLVMEGDVVLRLNRCVAAFFYIIQRFVVLITVHSSISPDEVR